MGQTPGKINGGGDRGGGGLIDEQMSTLTDGWLAGELLDCSGDDGCFLSVCVGVKVEREFESLTCSLFGITCQCVTAACLY